MRPSLVFSSLAASAAAVLLAGCASNTPAPLVDYQPENFDTGNAYMRHYAAPPARTCEAARRALLSQGYMMDAGQPNQVTGRKYFQPDRSHHVQLEFRVVCAAQGQDTGSGTTVFASGLQDQYSLRKTKESASLGVGVLGSLSVPLEGGTDQLVKVASQTVTDALLYRRFFDLIGGFLNSGEVPDNLTQPAATPPSEAAAAIAPAQMTSAALPAMSVAAAAPAAPASEPASAATPMPTPSEALPAASAAAP